MKVKELITKLLEFDMDTEITLHEEVGGNYRAYPAKTITPILKGNFSEGEYTNYTHDLDIAKVPTHWIKGVGIF